MMNAKEIGAWVHKEMKRLACSGGIDPKSDCAPKALLYVALLNCASGVHPLSDECRAAASKLKHF